MSDLRTEAALLLDVLQDRLLALRSSLVPGSSPDIAADGQDGAPHGPADVSDGSAPPHAADSGPTQRIGDLAALLVDGAVGAIRAARTAVEPPSDGGPRSSPVAADRAPAPAPSAAPAPGAAPGPDATPPAEAAPDSRPARPPASQRRPPERILIQ